MTERQRLAQGRRAEIFAWQAGQVLKLFRGPWPDEARHEARLAQAAAGQGVRTPRVLGQVEVDGRPGIIYERIDGPTLTSRLLAQPWRVRAFGRQLGELHAAVHQAAGPADLPSARQRLEHGLRRAAGLDVELREGALRVLAGLPDGDRLCHGDFHPDNVLLAANGPVVIDWPDACCGAPEADVARTVLLLRLASPPDLPLPMRVLITLVRRQFLAAYLRGYARCWPLNLAELRRWQVPLAGARLNEGIPGEAPRLVALVRAGLKEAAAHRW